jgi:hypothetical protein
MEKDMKGNMDVRKDVEKLSKLIGLTVLSKEECWDETRKRFRKFYSIKKISCVELELDPMPNISLIFSDGTCRIICSLEEFEKYSAEIGEYGSILEYLKDVGFSSIAV